MFILSITKKRFHLNLQSNGFILKPEAKPYKIYTTILENSTNHDYNKEDKSGYMRY